MTRRAKKRKQTGMILFLLGIVFVAFMIAALVWMLALQKQWTDFKIDFAEAAADGAAESSVIVTDGHDLYILHANNCQWFASQVTAAKQLPFQREKPETYALTLTFPNGSFMELAGNGENRVYLRFDSADGQHYRFALGDLAQWDTYYTILTEGFAYKNTFASQDAMLIP